MSISNAEWLNDGHVLLRPILLTTDREPLRGERFVLIDDAGWLGIASVVSKEPPLSACNDGPCDAGYRAEIVDRARRDPSGIVHALGPTVAPLASARRLNPPSGSTIVLEGLEHCPLGAYWSDVVAVDIDGDGDRDLELRQRLCSDHTRWALEFRMRYEGALAVVATASGRVDDSLMSLCGRDGGEPPEQNP